MVMQDCRRCTALTRSGEPPLRRRFLCSVVGVSLLEPAWRLSLVLIAALAMFRRSQQTSIHLLLMRLATRHAGPFWPRRPARLALHHPLTGGFWPSGLLLLGTGGPHLARAFRYPGGVEPGSRRSHRHQTFPGQAGWLGSRLGIGLSSGATDQRWIWEQDERLRPCRPVAGR